jgi:hypothetical protein
MRAQIRGGSKRVFGRSLLAGMVTVVALFGTTPVRAANVNVGTITLLEQNPLTSRIGGGEAIYAMQNVNLANTCLAGADVHWIQLAITTAPPGKVLPLWNAPAYDPKNLGLDSFSNVRTFIDPIPNQMLGVGPAVPRADDKPFYDVTGSSIAELQANPNNWVTNGTGRVFGDEPFQPWNKVSPFSPYTVTFQTLLVATPDGKPTTLLDLGGFQWGYTLTTNVNATISSETLQTPKALAWGDIDAKAWQTALNQFFGPPGTYTFAQATCPKDNPVVSFANPEPSTIVLVLIAIPCMLVVTARDRRRRAV